MPNHPVTRHIAVAYWKGGDETMDSQIVRTSRIDKITAWGGMSSVKHIQKFLSPGIDLTALNPKYSMSMIGRETFASEAAMEEAAMGFGTDLPASTTRRLAPIRGSSMSRAIPTTNRSNV